MHTISGIVEEVDVTSMVALGLSGQGNQLSPSLKSAIPLRSFVNAVSPIYCLNQNNLGESCTFNRCFGSTSQKGVKKKSEPVQEGEKGKDEFDGTNGAGESLLFIVLMIILLLI